MAEQKLSIYEKTEIDGPATKRHKKLVWIGYAVFVVLGLLPTLFKMSWAWRVFGAGLIVPGGGFLAIGGVSGVLFFLLTFLLLCVLGLGLWWATGAQFMPFLIWWGTAILTATVWLREPKWGAYTGIILALVLAALYFVGTRIHNIRKNKAYLARQKERLAFYEEEIPAELAMAEPEVPEGEFEMTEEQLRQERYLFDTALQPLGSWKGFNSAHFPQFSTNSVRYQINQILNTLQQIQCQYTPNFHGYANQAQQDLITRYTHPKMWRYWRLENIWGNGKLSGDPFKWDNVMMTGFFLINVTMYIRNTGDRRYEEPGSITFKDAFATYPYDVHRIAERIKENWANQEYIVYPCEPNFMYSLCNWKAIQSMVSYENLYNTTDWTDNEVRVYNAFVREMGCPDGSSYLFKSDRTGVGVNLPIPTAESFQITMYNTADPELARQTFAFFRQGSYKRDADGTLIHNAIPIDHGDFSMNYCDCAYLAMMPAAEMGDREAYEAAKKTLDERGVRIEENGTIHYRCSTEVNAGVLQSTINSRNGWRRAVVDGPAECTKNAPLLSDAKYEDVMVAKAFSHGTDLELVLYPFEESGCETTLGFSRLQAGATYTVQETGAQFTADGNGEASLTVGLSGRTPLTILPA
ncbi:MAG: hypothetical protein IKX83_03225 [Clostridia bacterium]|nr:hypothetical protein [Clostridia bacterium]